MKVIRSNYHEYAKEEFELEMLGETDTDYIVRIMPRWQHQFQEGDSIYKLRKVLFEGHNPLYIIIDREPVREQLTLF